MKRRQRKLADGLDLDVEPESAGTQTPSSRAHVILHGRMLNRLYPSNCDVQATKSNWRCVEGNFYNSGRDTFERAEEIFCFAS
jgi:hypothetical protein